MTTRYNTKILYGALLFVLSTVSLPAEVPDGREKTTVEPESATSKSFDFFYWGSEYKELYLQKLKQLKTLQLELTEAKKEKEKLATEKNEKEQQFTKLSRESSDRTTELTEKIKTLEEKIANLEKELKDQQEKCQKTIAEKDAKISALKKNSQSDCSGEKRKIADLNQRLQKLQQNIALAEKKNREYKYALERLKNEQNQQKSSCDTARQQLKQSNQQISTLKNQLKQRDTNLKECKDNLIGLDGTIKSLKKENTYLKNKIKAFSDRIARDGAEHNQLRQQYKQLAQKLKEQEEENRLLNRELSEALAAHKQSSQQQQEKQQNLQQQLDLAQKQNKNLQESLDITNQKNQKMSILIRNLDSGKDRLQAKNTKMRSLILRLIRNRRLKKQKIANRYKELENTFSKELAEGNIRFHKTSDRIVINLQDKISFRSGSSRLREQIKPSLDKIVKIITKYPGYRVYIEGHTDDVPLSKKAGFRDNWELSTERALSVLRYVLANHDLDAHRFSASGYGKHHPLFENDSRENRRKNRRVDIVLMYTEKEPEKKIEPQRPQPDDSLYRSSSELTPGSKEDSDPDFEIGK